MKTNETARPVEASAILRWMGAIMSERRARDGETITVGGGQGADLAVLGELGTGDAFALAACRAGTCEVNVPPGWAVVRSSFDTTPSGASQGERIEEPFGPSARRSSAEAGKSRPGTVRSLTIGGGERAVLSNQLFAIEVAMVGARPSLKRGLLKSVDRLFAGWLGAAALLVLSVVAAVLFVIREEPVTADSTLVKQHVKYIQQINKKPEPIDKVAKFEPKQIEVKQAKPVDRPSSAQIPRRPMSKEELRQSVRDKGLVKILSGGGMINRILFASDLGPGTIDFLTGQHGTVVATAGGGMDGLGGPRQGSGPGTVIGIESAGPIDPERRRRGIDVAIQGKPKEETKVQGGSLLLQGGLEKEVVAKVIQRHWAQVKHCYDKELNKNPNLFGKVVVQFTIGGAGKVDEAHVSETQMNSEGVEGCLTRNIRMWVFPEPKGGGQVFVTYPFVFTSAGN